MDSETLQDLGEDEVITRLTSLLPRSSRVIEGVGDDCAVVQPPKGTRVQLLKTDVIIEGVHFTPNEIPERVGWKALARVVSDIAAMGGTPECALITLIAPKNTLFSKIEGIYRGLLKCAQQFEVDIVGGETSSGAQLTLSISLTGSVEQDRWVTRNKAKLGDAIFVTGYLGGSIQGHHLDFVPRLAEAQWLVDHFKPTAMMDLSDGVAKDLPRLAKASGVSFELDPRLVPVRSGCTYQQALNDGEDYELLFTLPSEQAEPLLLAWSQKFPSLPLSRIGVIQESSHPSILPKGGWDHFGG